MDEIQKAQIVVFVVGVLFIGAALGLVGHSPTETVYDYEIKSEQVASDAGNITEAVQYENLPQAEQEAIYEAQKESDHFLGGASVQLRQEEKLGLEESPNWRVVDIEGVYVFVGIHGPEVHEVSRQSLASFIFALILAVLGAIFVGTSAVGLSDPH